MEEKSVNATQCPTLRGKKVKDYRQMNNGTLEFSFELNIEPKLFVIIFRKN